MQDHLPLKTEMVSKHWRDLLGPYAEEIIEEAYQLIAEGNADDCGVKPRGRYAKKKKPLEVRDAA